MTHPVLTALGLSEVESGTYLGHGEWSKTRDAGVIEPVNPSNGEVLGKVHASSQADYDVIVECAQAAFGTRVGAEDDAVPDMQLSGVWLGADGFLRLFAEAGKGFFALLFRYLIIDLGPAVLQALQLRLALFA